MIQGPGLVLVRPGGQGSQLHAGADQGAGLVDVHVFQFGQGQFASLGGQVDGLSAAHAA